MQIRQAALADLDGIESLWREMMDFHIACDDYFTMGLEAASNHRQYITGLLQDQSKRIFVAAEDNQLLGYLMAEINAYPPIYLHQNYGHIGAVSVTESARRRGIGRKLLNAA
jgi:ribosomal protein S18 acetylase RimI-like enzyme